MTEMQQAAKSAMAPAMIAASSEPPKKMLLLITSHHFQEAETRRPTITSLPPTVHSALPVSLVSGTGHRLGFGDDGNLGAFDLGDLTSDGFLLILHTRHAGLKFRQAFIARQSSRQLISLHLSGRIPIPSHATHHEQHRERTCGDKKDGQGCQNQLWGYPQDDEPHHCQPGEDLPVQAHLYTVPYSLERRGVLRGHGCRGHRWCHRRSHSSVFRLWRSISWCLLFSLPHHQPHHQTHADGAGQQTQEGQKVLHVCSSSSICCNFGTILDYSIGGNDTIVKATIANGTSNGESGFPDE